MVPLMQMSVSNLARRKHEKTLRLGAFALACSLRMKSNSFAAGAREEFLGTVDNWLDNCSGKDEEKLKGERGDWWWTGVKPTSTVHSLPQLLLRNCNASDLKAYFSNSWLLTELLYSGLQGEEAFYRPPYHNLRHPLIFYYAHPAVLYINKLVVAGLIPEGINPYFEDIFEVGVDEMRWDDISTIQKAWPTVGDVIAYRKQVYKTVCDVIDDNLKGPMDITMDTNLWAIPMGIEHERIHFETSSVLIRELPVHLVRKPKFWPDIHPSSNGTQADSDPYAGIDFPSNELVSVPSTSVELGKPRDFPTFGWDNEYGHRHITVPRFHASKFMVSNGEFYEFVKDGGYQKEEFWSSDGWQWRKFRNAKWPFFWEQSGPSGSHKYMLRTIFEVINMPWNWPVLVNYHEATAFTNWKTSQSEFGKPGAQMRLITEAEHQALRNVEHRTPLRSYEDDPAIKMGGKELKTNGIFNYNFAYSSESPVDFLPPSSKGHYDVMGNVWEWAEDDFNPLEGFAIHKYYDDFSTPCFDGEHNMILGGSFISCGDAGANLNARYHFRPHFLQHSGFRYILPSIPEKNVKGERIAQHLGEKAMLHNKNGDQHTSHTSDNVIHSETNDFDRTNLYETSELVQQYLALHFGQTGETVDVTIRKHPNRPDHALNFPKRSAELVVRVAKDAGVSIGSFSRALDLGCAVGGTSFHLAESFGEVVGIDSSHAFINCAKSIQNHSLDIIDFNIPLQGKITKSLKAPIPSLAQRKKVRFLLGDACNLPHENEFGGRFDAILLANLLCRLPNPRKCLLDVSKLLKHTGIIVIISPYSWLEEYTPIDQWLQTNEKFSSDYIEDIMAENSFNLVCSEDVPLLIREHERKYQYIVSHAQAFSRKII